MAAWTTRRTGQRPVRAVEQRVASAASRAPNARQGPVAVVALVAVGQPVDGLEGCRKTGAWRDRAGCGARRAARAAGQGRPGRSRGCGGGSPLDSGRGARKERSGGHVCGARSRRYLGTGCLECWGGGHVVSPGPRGVDDSVVTVWRTPSSQGRPRLRRGKPADRAKPRLASTSVSRQRGRRWLRATLTCLPNLWGPVGQPHSGIAVSCAPRVVRLAGVGVGGVPAAAPRELRSRGLPGRGVPKGHLSVSL